MISRKGLVTIDDILRIVREDYPDMTADELQKHLDTLVNDGADLHRLVVSPPPSHDRRMRYDVGRSAGHSRAR